MKSDKPVALSRRDARAIVRLLGGYQTFLEDAIENTLCPGDTEPRDEIDRQNVAADRVTWRLAEAYITVLSGQTKIRKTR